MLDLDKKYHGMSMRERAKHLRDVGPETWSPDEQMFMDLYDQVLEARKNAMEKKPD